MSTTHFCGIVLFHVATSKLPLILDINYSETLVSTLGRTSSYGLRQQWLD